jgi:hypothetical protein
MISTRDIDAYLMCKENLDKPRYVDAIKDHLKKRCPKLNVNEKWVKPFCGQLEPKAKAYIEILSKLTKKDLQSVLDNLGYSYYKNSAPKTELIKLVLVRLSHCRNSYTVGGYNITELEPKKLYKTKNNFCHDVDELVEYLIATGDRDYDPNDPNNAQKIWNNQFQKFDFFTNPNINKQALKKYKQMKDQAVKKQIGQMNMDLYKFIEMVGKLGFVFANDETTSHAQTGFDTSAKLIAKFTQILEQSPTEVKDKIMNLKNYNGDTIAEILSKTNSTCIHGVGFSFAKVYFYNYLKYKRKFPDIQLLPLFLKKDNFFVCPQFLQGKALVKAVQKAVPEQPVDFIYYFPDPNTGKFESYKRVPGKLQLEQIEAMQELISEFDLV